MKFSGQFTSDETALLKRLNQIEVAAKTINGVLTIGVFQDLFGKPTVQKVYSFTTQEWDLFTQAVQGTAKLAACSAKTEFDQFVLENNGSWPNTPGSQFLSEMAAIYEERCAK